MKIRKDDNVIVMSGKDTKQKVLKDVKNDDGTISKVEKKVKLQKTGRVLKVFTKTNRVLVEGVNVVTRHYKKSGTTPGQMIKKENPIDISNVMLICPFTAKPTRIGFVFVKDKKGVKKFRFSKMALKLKGGESKDYIIK